MKAMFDFKSLATGVILAALVLLALGASLNNPPQPGRFQIETTGSHVFVIDTATGQVWGKYVIPRRDAKDEEFMKPKLPLDKS
jgi:hypothetical protein